MIDLLDIAVYYNNHKSLDGLSLHVAKGTLLGVLGPGGCGKSTMCKVIAGLVKPQKGIVLVNGVKLMEATGKDILNLQKKIGMQFQNDALFEHMSVLENVSYPLKRLTDKSEDEVEYLAVRQITMVGLSGYENSSLNKISGGQRRRVALARACVTSPDILICDDPTAGLDPVTSRKILDMIAGIRVEGESTIIVVSSDVPGLLSISSRVALLWDGRIIEEEKTSEFKKSETGEVRRFLKDAVLPFKNWSWS
ncbi:MAG: ATP-binding cassette domain-containing protein [Deltaproteobacteria bacterium]|nr:ATP-binding cassette domain-containing protein [Deltaproteobacteria bacterium]